IGLRAYSIQRKKATLSSAIMFRNERIARLFREEFTENWRLVEGMTDAVRDRLLAYLADGAPAIQEKAQQSVASLLGESGAP
ncbi:MAG: hypothetical protein M3O15_05155, partial [Acidobacteriota bacterium]|nr:hypothetical protein [Acidobacteriota bacterium]